MSHIDPLLPGMLLLAAVGFLLVRRRPRQARALLLVALGAIFLASWPPAVWLAARVMESGYDRLGQLPTAEAQAVVIVSSGVYAPLPPQPKFIAGAATYSRTLHGAWIAQQAPDLPIVVSGGLERHGPGSAHADVMKQLLLQLGVDASRIVAERESRNTHENAALTWGLLEPSGIRRIVLVTDALHLRRAELCFRSVGFEVEPSPIHLEPDPALGQLATWVPQADALRKADSIIHELVGLIYYRLRGWL